MTINKYIIQNKSDLKIAKNIFRSYGFLIIRGKVNLAQVKSLRMCLDNKAFNENLLSASILDFLSEELFFDPICNSFVNSVLMEIHGSNLKIYPNFTARKNTYSPWHVDEAFKTNSIAGDMDETDFTQCSLFLQDNDLVFGGGLDVIVGSHKLAENNQVDVLENNINILNFLRLKSNILTIESQKGDIILWDGRLFHRSTVAVKKSHESKYSLMWTVSNYKANHEGFLNHLVQRGKRNDNYSDIYDKRYNEISMLSSLPVNIHKKLQKAGLNIKFFE